MSDLILVDDVLEHIISQVGVVAIARISLATNFWHAQGFIWSRLRTLRLIVKYKHEDVDPFSAALAALEAKFPVLPNVTNLIITFQPPPDVFSSADLRRRAQAKALARIIAHLGPKLRVLDLTTSRKYARMFGNILTCLDPSRIEALHLRGIDVQELTWPRNVRFSKLRDFTVEFSQPDFFKAYHFTLVDLGRMTGALQRITIRYALTHHAIGPAGTKLAQFCHFNTALEIVDLITPRTQTSRRDACLALFGHSYSQPSEWTKFDRVCREKFSLPISRLRFHGTTLWNRCVAACSFASLEQNEEACRVLFELCVEDSSVEFKKSVILRFLKIKAPLPPGIAAWANAVKQSLE